MSSSSPTSAVANMKFTVHVTNHQIILILGGAALLYGTIGLLSLLIRITKFLYRSWFRSSYDLVKRYGKGWAVITGATDGIGKAISFDLAKQGFNIVLISRTLEKLHQCRDEIVAKYPHIRVECIQVEFSSKGFDIQQRKDLETQLRSLPDGGVAILVNNVGISYDFPMFFDEMDDQRVDDMTSLNCTSTAILTHMVLKIMLSRNVVKGSKRGAILNIGSSAGLFANPLLSQYSGAKAYIQKFTEGLAIEYKSKGIDIQVTTPMFITTKLAKIRKPSLTVPTAEQFSTLIVGRIGYETIVNPYFWHAIPCAILKAFPWTGRVILSHHLPIRSKGMKKRQGQVEGSGGGDKKDL
jgi:17beta-estradiol 17-dehydrogenase / very-long-chain 3-oxoacyl-CoA reductase